MNRSDFFSRNFGRVDIARLTDTFVVVAGVGSVGSTMAEELARGCGVGHLVLADGDHLDIENLSRHALPALYLGLNKAEAMASHLTLNVPGLDVAGTPHHIDESFSDAEIDLLFAPADLVVIATDQLPAQRRLAARALAMDIPAIVPALYGDHGGEVFVQLSPREACFSCWDNFREPDTQVRGVTSVNADSLSVIQQATYLCLAVLEPDSRHVRDLAPTAEDRRPRQLFQLRPGGALLRSTVNRRPDCPGCAVGPSPMNGRRPSGAAARRMAGRLGTGHPRVQAAGWPLVLTGEQAPPTIHAVRVSEEFVLEGSMVTLSWRAENATNVVVETLGTHPPEGELPVLVNRTTSFRVHAANPFGEVTATSPVVRALPLPRLREIRVPTLVPSSAPGTSASVDVQRPQLGGDPAQVENSPASRLPASEMPTLTAIVPRPLRASAFMAGPVISLQAHIGRPITAFSRQDPGPASLRTRLIRRVAEHVNQRDMRPS